MKKIISIVFLLGFSLASWSRELYYTAYMVRPGDTIRSIASGFNVSVDSIISLNSMKTGDLSSCPFLKVPSMSGILYRAVDDVNVSSIVSDGNLKKTCLVNSLTENAIIKKGSALFIPDGKIDLKKYQEIMKERIFHIPIRNSYRISSAYGWRIIGQSRTYHGGIDLACPEGTEIYPTLPGIVEECGYDGTYGNYVLVRHGSTGYTSLYGHMKKINVQKNERVKLTSVIGYVGSTGFSTGNHLHFTVFKNGKIINPDFIFR